MLAAFHSRHRVRALVPLVVALIGVGAIACNDDDDDILITQPNTVVVSTFRDQAFNFTTLRTFAMPDTVVQFAPLTGTPLPVSRQYDQTILSRVRSDLLARGYVQVADPRVTRPSFVVLVGTTATTNYNAFVSYPWYSVWGFYPGWASVSTAFDASWGIVYPWYATVGVTAYDRGTILVDLIPTLSVNPLAKSVTSAWAGVATALLNGTQTTASINAAIDEMFNQSPYLVAGPVQ